MDAVLLKPLPYPEPERIVRVLEAPTPTDPQRHQHAQLRRLEAAEHVVRGALGDTRAERGADRQRGPGTARRACSCRPTTSTVFGVKAALGRTFLAGEDQPGASRVVVLSHATWQGRFGGDPAILNRDIMLDGEPHQVVGILPAGSFDRGERRLLEAARVRAGPADARLPLARRRRPSPARRDVDQAREEMRAVSESLAPLQPAFKRDWRVAIDPFDQDLVSGKSPPVDRRGIRRRRHGPADCGGQHREPAPRQGRGAPAGNGGPRGARREPRPARRAGAHREPGALSSRRRWPVSGSPTSSFRSPFRCWRPTLPSTASVALDPRVLGFAAVTAVGVSALVGLLPSLQLSSGRLSQALNLATRGSSSREGVRRTIVIAEVAVSLILICGAVLMFKSLLKLQRVDAGVRIDNVITMSADLPLGHLSRSRARDPLHRSRWSSGFRRSPASSVPPSRRMCRCSASGRATPSRCRALTDGVGAGSSASIPHYFATLDIPVLVGRGFSGARPRRRPTRRGRQRGPGARGWRSGSASPTRRRSSAGSSSSPTRCTRTAVRPARRTTSRSSA